MVKRNAARSLAGWTVALGCSLVACGMPTVEEARGGTSSALGRETCGRHGGCGGVQTTPPPPPAPLPPPPATDAPAPEPEPVPQPVDPVPPPALPPPAAECPVVCGPGAGGLACFCYANCDAGHFSLLCPEGGGACQCRGADGALRGIVVAHCDEPGDPFRAYSLCGFPGTPAK